MCNLGDAHSSPSICWKHMRKNKMADHQAGASASGSHIQKQENSIIKRVNRTRAWLQHNTNLKKIPEAVAGTWKDQFVHLKMANWTKTYNLCLH
jgi:hypothetical protein